MKGVIQRERTGIIHAIAHCDNLNCNWDSAIILEENNPMDKLRIRIKNHIKNTGHSITLETGNSTKYYLETI